MITGNCSNQALLTLFVAVFGSKISDKVWLLPCSADKVGDEPILDVVMGSDIGEWFLIDDYLVDNADLVCRSQLGDGELLLLTIGEELVSLSQRIRLGQLLLVPVLGTIELLLEILLPDSVCIA